MQLIKSLCVLSGTVLITGGILSTVDFSIVNTGTGAKGMKQGYWSFISVQFLQVRHIQ
jgi:hypothetical protein